MDYFYINSSEERMHSYKADKIITSIAASQRQPKHMTR